MPLTVTERGARPAIETRSWRPSTDDRTPSVLAKTLADHDRQPLVIGQVPARQRIASPLAANQSAVTRRAAAMRASSDASPPI